MAAAGVRDDCEFYRLGSEATLTSVPSTADALRGAVDAVARGGAAAPLVTASQGPSSPAAGEFRRGTGGFTFEGRSRGSAAARGATPTLDVMMQSASRTKLLRLFPAVFKGTHVELDQVRTAGAKVSWLNRGVANRSRRD